MNLRNQIIPFIAALLVLIPLVLIIRNLHNASGENTSAQATNQSIKIADASWGLKCNGRQDPKSGQPYNIPANNVLAKVAALCDQHANCAINVSPAFFGFDPAPTCSKHLEVAFRCFSYDRRHEAASYSGQILTIDCANPDNSHSSVNQTTPMPMP